MGEEKIYNKDWFQKIVLVLAAVFIVYFMAYFEIINRAKTEYKNGEVFLKEGDYRQALWSYQAVLDFYYKPESKWVEKARVKVEECRAALKKNRSKDEEALFPQLKQTLGK